MSSTSVELREQRKGLQLAGFSLGKKIGQGTYSKVCVVSNSTQRFACKIVNRKKAGEDFVLKFLPREMSILKSIKHPHIVTVHNIIEWNQFVFIVMDYCSEGDLLDYIQKNGALGEFKSKTIFRQLASAIGYLHGINIAHRDVKCENILLTSAYNVKLGDFGFARGTLESSGQKVMSRTFCGSAAYAAPEVLQGHAYDPKMMDIWSLGCVLYVILTGLMPFDDNNVGKMMKDQQKKSLVTQLRGNFGFSMPLISLMRRILEPNSLRRISIQQIISSCWLAKSSGDGAVDQRVSSTVQ